MNCHDFEANIIDLARGRLMDAALRENAIAHTGSCAICASRLADERALTNGLRAVVAGAADEQAPARVEAALLEAFRQQRVPLPAIAPAQNAGHRWLYAAAAVAAVAIIVTLLALITSRTHDSLPPVQQKAGNESPSDEKRPQGPQPLVSPGSPEQKALAIEPRRVTERAKNIARGKRGTSGSNSPAADTEIATEFIPLMNRESLAELDGGQVMRVELPRSALMSFGLPMDMERAAERIKADVVVGNDGLARAIRFVR